MSNKNNSNHNSNSNSNGNSNNYNLSNKQTGQKWGKPRGGDWRKSEWSGPKSSVWVCVIESEMRAKRFLATFVGWFASHLACRCCLCVCCCSQLLLTVGIFACSRVPHCSAYAMPAPHRQLQLHPYPNPSDNYVSHFRLRLRLPLGMRLVTANRK